MSQIIKYILINDGFIFLLFIIVNFISKTNIYKKIEALLIGKYYVLKSKNKKSKKVRIQKNCVIKNVNSISFGNNVTISNSTQLFPLGGNYPSEIIIGNNVFINDYNRYSSAYKISIDDDCVIAAYVHITDHNHEYKDIDIPISKQGIFSNGEVHICKGCWLGLGCEILSGVTIGEHSVVAARAVVTKDVPPYSIVAGIPARVIKKYDFESKKWIDVK